MLAGLFSAVSGTTVKSSLLQTRIVARQHIGALGKIENGIVSANACCIAWLNQFEGWRECDRPSPSNAFSSA